MDDGWGAEFVSKRNSLSFLEHPVEVFLRKKKSVSILRAAANEQQWERGYFWNNPRHLVINSTFPCQVQGCKKGFGLHDKNDYCQRLSGLCTDMLPSA